MKNYSITREATYIYIYMDIILGFLKIKKLRKLLLIACMHLNFDVL